MKGKYLNYCQASFSELWNSRYLIAFSMVCLSATPVFAGTTIFGAASNATTPVIEALQTFVNETLAPVSIIITLIGMMIFGKNEKVMPLLKEAFKWEVIALVGVNCFAIIIDTVMWLINLFKGTQ